MSNRPYPELSEAIYRAIVNGKYVKSSRSGTNPVGCLSFTEGPNGLVGFQDDKLPPEQRRTHTLIFTRQEFTAFAAALKAGEFDHLIESN